VCTSANGQASCSNPLKTLGSTCNDNDPNTVNDACDARGNCVGTDNCGDVSCQALGPCGTIGTCDPTTGQCSHPLLSAGSICDDGDPKSVDDTCDAVGNCAGQLPEVDGGWTEWSTCSVTCGGGTETRSCTNPTPTANGRTCCPDGTVEGTDACPDTRTCNTDKCANALLAAQAAADQAQAAAAAAAATGTQTACSSQPCENGGSCTVSSSTPSGYVCACLPGWQGTVCDATQTQTVVPDNVWASDEARTTRLENIYDSVLGTPRYGALGTGQWWAKYDPNGQYLQNAMELSSQQAKVEAGVASSDSHLADTLSPPPLAVGGVDFPQTLIDQKSWDQEEKPQVLALISAT